MHARLRWWLPGSSPAPPTILIRPKWLLAEPGFMENNNSINNKDTNISEAFASSSALKGARGIKERTRRSLEENNSRKGWDENHWKAAGVLNSPSGGLFKVSKASSSADANAKWEWTAGRKEPSMHFSFCFPWTTSETRCRCSLNVIGRHNLVVRIKHIPSKVYGEHDLRRW